MNKRAKTDGIVRDNHIYGIIVSANGYFSSAQAGYYRRRTVFVGLFTGSYDEAQRLAAIWRNSK